MHYRVLLKTFEEKAQFKVRMHMVRIEVLVFFLRAAFTNGLTVSEYLRKGVEISDKVQIAHIEGRGLGLVAKERISKETTVVRVALKRCIVASPIENSRTGELLAQKLAKAWLCNDTARILPREERIQGLPVHWKDSLPFPLEERVAARRRRRVELSQYVQNATALSHALDAVSTRSFRIEATRSRTALMLAIFIALLALSESISPIYLPSLSFLLVLPRLLIANDAVLIPGADLCNHMPSANTRIVYDALFDCIQVRAKSLEPGDEVALDYGAKSNDEFLLDWAFVLPDNRHDSLTLDLGRHGACRIGRSARLTWLDSKGMPTASPDDDDQRLSLLTETASSIRYSFRKEVATLYSHLDSDGKITEESRQQKKLGLQWRLEKLILLDEFLDE